MMKNLARLGAGPALFACGLAGLLAVTGCSSSSPPPWASALGSGVTVQGPAQVSAGNDSPGAAIQGLFNEINAKHFTAECSYVEPSSQSACKSGAASASASTQPTIKNPGIGYVAIDGDKALVGSTGTFCVPNETPKCYTNNDPAAIFSSKKSFNTLWNEANSSANSSSNVYSLAPCIEVGGKWYLYESTS